MIRYKIRVPYLKKKLTIVVLRHFFCCKCTIVSIFPSNLKKKIKAKLSKSELIFRKKERQNNINSQKTLQKNYLIFQMRLVLQLLKKN